MNSKKINNYSNQNKINFSVVYVPDYEIDFNQIKKIRAIMEKLKINFIDTHEEIFKNYENKIELFSYYIPYHLNGKGYKLVADLISKKIR